MYVFLCVCVFLTEVGKLLVILPEADWVLYGCQKPPSSLSLVCIVLLPCLTALHFGWDPNPLFHLHSLRCCSSFATTPFSPSPSSSAPSLSHHSLSVLMFFVLHDLPRNIEHVNSVCLKLGFGRRDQRCHNRITVPDHMGPPGTVRHPSLSDVFASRKCFFLCTQRLVFQHFFLFICYVFHMYIFAYSFLAQRNILFSFTYMCLYMDLFYFFFSTL